MDMFYTRFKNNVMDTKAGLDYRENILKPGGTKVVSVYFKVLFRVLISIYQHY